MGTGLESKFTPVLGDPITFIFLFRSLQTRNMSEISWIDRSWLYQMALTLYTVSSKEYMDLLYLLWLKWSSERIK